VVSGPSTTRRYHGTNVDAPKTPSGPRRGRPAARRDLVIVAGAAAVFVVLTRLGVFASTRTWIENIAPRAPEVVLGVLLMGTLAAASIALLRLRQSGRDTTLLHEAEQRYRTLVEQLPTAVYVDAADEIATARYLSPQYEQLTGYSPAERLADPELWVRMLHPEDRERVLAESDRTNETGEPFDVEYRVVRADGEIRWLHDHALQVVGADGDRSWQGVLTDITDRKTAEESLDRRDRILEAAGAAAERFLRSGAWRDCIDDVLRGLGRAAGASRAGVFENIDGPDGLRVRLLGAWLADDAPPSLEGGPSARSDRYGEDFRRWELTLARGAVIQGRVDDFPSPERPMLVASGIRAVVAVPVHVDGTWWGYVAFDQCDRPREWQQAEVDAIRVVANTLGAAIVRERDARELMEAQERYRSLIETIPAVTYIDNVGPLSEAVYMSPQVEDVFGYTAEQWIADPTLWERGLHPDDHDHVVALVRRLNETGEPYHAEYRFVRPDGRIVWVSDHAVVLRDADGEPRLAQGVFFDISAHRAAEEQLREAEERYRAIVEHVPAAIYLDLADRSMRSVYVSPQIEEITGVPPREWLGDPELWLKIMPPEDREEAGRTYLEALSNGRPWKAEYRILTRDGRTIWVHDETTLLHDDQGRPTYLQGVLMDITDRKLADEALRESEQREREAAERLRALDEMKNTFLAAVSHELRSPLTSILGLSLTLERAHDMREVDRADLLHRLSSNARKLDRLLKDLLDIDRLNRGIVEPQYRAADVGALARRTVESLEGSVDRQVVTDVRPVVLTIDPPKVERIVENLVTNAIRHTDADRTIWVKVRPNEGGALISIEDDGPGVSPELREAIFEPFRQGPTAAPHAPGTGIGLSLVTRFAELHGGRAWVDERVGGGAAFRVFLPAGPGSLELPPVQREDGAIVDAIAEAQAG
jgi:PAS domain S-box-containing protein